MSTEQIKSWMSPAEAADTYATTPAWFPSPGKSLHTGNGLWATMCRECEHTVTHWGVMPRYATIGQHERQAHDLDVPGINVGMMSS